MKPLEYAENSGTAPNGAIAEVLHAGWEKCKPRHHAAIPRDHYLLHLVLSGSGRLRVKGKTYTIRSHECFLVRPFEEHAYQADTDNPWEYLWLGFTGITDEILEEVYGVPAELPAFRPSSPARLEFHMRRILDALQSDNPLEQLFSRAISVLALGCLGERSSNSEGRNEAPDYVEEAVSYIESHYAQLRNAQSVAEFVGLDRSYFSKIFQERTGISVARFIAETRMSHAKRLLVDTDYKVKAISSLVGYDNYQSFERRFTAVVGMSPSEFRLRPAGHRIKAGKHCGPSGTSLSISKEARIPPAAPEATGTNERADERSDAAERTGEAVSRGTPPLKDREATAKRRDVNTLLSGAPGCPSYMRKRAKKRTANGNEGS